MIEIREVLSRKEQKIFATFNYKMYKNVFQAIPDLIIDELDYSLLVGIDYVRHQSQKQRFLICT